MKKSGSGGMKIRKGKEKFKNGGETIYPTAIVQEWKLFERTH